MHLGKSKTSIMFSSWFEESAWYSFKFFCYNIDMKMPQQVFRCSFLELMLMSCCVYCHFLFCFVETTKENATLLLLLAYCFVRPRSPLTQQQSCSHWNNKHPGTFMTGCNKDYLVPSGIRNC